MYRQTLANLKNIYHTLKIMSYEFIEENELDIIDGLNKSYENTSAMSGSLMEFNLTLLYCSINKP